MTDDLLRDLAKDIPFDQPTAVRRDAIRSSLLVEASESTDARPAAVPARRWPVAVAFVSGALAAAAIALIVVRPSATKVERTNLAQITATTPDVRIDHQIVATETGSDEIVRVRDGKLALAIPAQRRGDRMVIQTGSASVEGDAGELEVVVAADQLQVVHVKAGTARVVVIGQAPVVLSAGQTWRASVITTDLSPRTPLVVASAEPAPVAPAPTSAPAIEPDAAAPGAPTPTAPGAPAPTAPGTSIAPGRPAATAPGAPTASGAPAATAPGAPTASGTPAVAPTAVTKSAASAVAPTAVTRSAVPAVAPTAATKSVAPPRAVAPTAVTRSAVPAVAPTAVTRSAVPAVAPTAVTKSAAPAVAPTAVTTRSAASAVAPTAVTKSAIAGTESVPPAPAIAIAPAAPTKPVAAPAPTRLESSSPDGKPTLVIDAPAPAPAVVVPVKVEPAKPASIEQQFQAGWALLKAGKAREAATALGAAADATPNAPLAADARYFQAVALVRANDARTAERVLVQFLDTAPKSLRRGRASVLLGRLLAERGDMKSARAWLETAIHDPDPAIANAARAGLQSLTR